MKVFITGSIGLLLALSASAQTLPAARRDTLFTDSLPVRSLQEVIVIARQSIANKNPKLLSGLDSYLESHQQVNMIKRGAYAWEPLLNGMATERSVITIDGMRIYGACTDKMDPVTSYVETTNLSQAVIHSGQSGGANGATIAGSIDLVRNKAGFGPEGSRGQAFAGFETNNQQKIAGGAYQYSTEKSFADLDLTYRDANNYKAGKGDEVSWSQFTKYNVSANLGRMLSPHQQVEASLIYDRASNVGYPALPMDVSLAEAFIGSLAYKQHQPLPFIDYWESKLYYNSVTHVMDDSQRPDVPVRMDMPGWSRTSGGYSVINGEARRHQWKATLSAHHNYSLAEMTMFSNDPGEKDMFMLTWPGVHTYYGGLFASDQYAFASNWTLSASAGLGMQYNRVNQGLGLESMQIFYPDMSRSQQHWLKSFAASLRFKPSSWQFSLGAAYGERAPGVSEGYGFYLFNSFDRFDYIGNPHLKKERSLEANASIGFSNQQLDIQWKNAFFHINDYIIGIPDPAVLPMTIGAAGIKVYQSLRYAQLFNSSLEAAYTFSPLWSLSGKASYRRGRSNEGGNLPLIQPLSYGSTLQFKRKALSSGVSLEGALRQTKYNPAFGETAAGAYTLVNLWAGYKFKLGQQSLLLKAGAENLLDRRYSTFADWNRIPRMGRNIFVNAVFGF
ncbi:MAG: hypothetical protein P0Y53_00540 [Candidatus Pseudobacter hemicellulosilyticus]|uniref:Iron complex outermembrane receptor protein n=1 Tax=Candidatus Pseudobacter hemicellulosilyticus TaxID=3121375 RepID=A0AAJ5WUN9_9BACT|nr:MAG: hypothetical protein P0Y53_00540 [Pseudobacter sp.]